MTDFARDLSVLIDEGCIAPKGKIIRFSFAHPDRLEGNLEMLGLSERAYNCCRRSRIDCIEDVNERWGELVRMKGAGKKTVKEVRNKFLSFYYDTLNDEERKQFWRDTVRETIGI